jgi:cysteine desulfurase
VTIIHAQNEIGTLQPVAEIVRQVQSVGALIHTDAAQSIGKVVVDVNKLGVDLLSIAGHKLYAPKGTGALYVRRGVKLPPLLVGASQERGLRPGTENVAYIVALGEACRLASMTLEKASQQMAFAANHFFSDTPAKHSGDRPGWTPDGASAKHAERPVSRRPGRQLLESCPDVFASNGSACHADSEEHRRYCWHSAFPAKRRLVRCDFRSDDRPQLKT